MYKETFKSPFEKDTEAEAQTVLDSIREVHSEKYGWKEIKGYIETSPNGKYRAVREHVKE